MKGKAYSSTLEYHRLWRKRTGSNNRSSLLWRIKHEARNQILRSNVRARLCHSGKPILDSEEVVQGFIDSKSEECGICGNKRKLVLDHDHKTGKVRGWVCRHCNSCLSLLDNHLSEALAWLKRGFT